MLPEILITTVITIILIGVGCFITFTLLKKDIDEKASINTLTDTVNQVNTNDSTLIQHQTDLMSSFSNDSTKFNMMYNGLNSNVIKNTSTIDLMNTNIYQLQGNFASNNSMLSNLNLNFNNQVKDYKIFSSNTTASLTDISNTYVSKNFLKSDFASIDNNTFNLAPKSSKVTITGKPLQVDSINMNLWKMTPQDGKLCFSKNNTKAMCITSQPNGIEIYKADGSTILLPQVNSATSATIPVTTSTTSTIAPFTNKKEIEYTENFIRASQ